MLLALKLLLLLTTLDLFIAWGIVTAANQTMGAASWLARYAALFELDLTWSFALFRLLGLNTNWQVPATAFPEVPVMALDLAEVALTAFLPVFAAISIAQPREQVNDPTPEVSPDLNPLQVLSVQGLGAVGPILGVFFLVQLGWSQLWTCADPPARFSDLVWSNLWAVGSIGIRVGILVSISALCRRTRTALWICCSLLLVVAPLLDALFTMPEWLTGAPPAWWWLFSDSTLLLLEAAAFTFLLPRAADALTRAHDTAAIAPALE